MTYELGICRDCGQWIDDCCCDGVQRYSGIRVGDEPVILAPIVTPDNWSYARHLAYWLAVRQRGSSFPFCRFCSIAIECDVEPCFADSHSHSDGCPTNARFIFGHMFWLAWYGTKRRILGRV